MKTRSSLTLHPEVLTKNGKKEFVVLPFEEFEAVQELLADAEDLLDLRRAKKKEGKSPTTPLAQIKRELGLA